MRSAGELTRGKARQDILLQDAKQRAVDHLPARRMNPRRGGAQMIACLQEPGD